MESFLSGVASAALAIVTTLGGVQVSISGSESGSGIKPMEPNEEQMGNVWPSESVYPGQRILMSNSTFWVVKRSQIDGSGVLTIEVRPNTSTSKNIKVEIQPVDFATRIWWTADEWDPSPPEGETEPTPGETPPFDPPIPPPLG